MGISKSVQRKILNGNGEHGDTEVVKTSAAVSLWRAFSRLWESRGLPAKLIALTVLFVLIAEALIFVPAISNFRVTGW